jgi:YVTN family beta-propeller protein
LGDNAVLPISTATSKPGRAIRVGNAPESLVITPNGKTVYVANWASDTVTPISTATNKPGRAIKVDVSPGVLGITPNGKTVYAGNGSVGEYPSPTRENAVVPVSTATNTAGRAILVAPGSNPLGGSADAFAFTPDSKTAYVAVAGTYEVDPIRVATGRLGEAIETGASPGAIVITPNGKTAYVGNFDADTVTPFSTVTNRPGKAITVGARLSPFASTAAIAITPNGRTLYVGTESFVPGVDDLLTPVSTATNKPGKSIRVGQGVDAITITPNSRTAYVASFNAGTVTPVRVATNTAASPISVGTDLGPYAMAITPNGRTVYVASVATCASAGPPGNVLVRTAHAGDVSSAGVRVPAGSGAAGEAAPRRR